MTTEPKYGEWLPIESAPRDGTPVLVCGPDINGSVYMDACAWPKGWTVKWPVEYIGYSAGEPTHWMPLPPPPAKDTP